MTELQRRIVSILEDGNWHGIPEFYEACAPLITPEWAVRRYVLENGTIQDDRIAIAVVKGKWRIISYYLTNYKYDGWIEGRGRGSTREYRKIKERTKRRR